MPYLIEYPENIMREKIAVMTDLLEDTFGEKMISHRAGRWSFNETYARILVEKGYRVDCSVTPHISWKDMPGDPNQKGGTDFTQFPEEAYFVDPKDISRKGDSALLEVPVTIVPSENRLKNSLYNALRPFPLAQRAFNRFFPSMLWLRPDGRNRKDLLRLLQTALNHNKNYVEFMLHSSELMPGGSPRFPGEKNVELLYTDLEALFSEAGKSFQGMTLKQYYNRIQGSGGCTPNALR